ncbi:MAG: hypothetical protein LAT81_00150 [Oceanicaulis sp.]|nr:hypothetical protein [Oceanicaulis sp.]
MSLIVTIAGVICILAGLVLAWSPVPLGIVLIPAGAAMIVTTSGRARSWLHRRRVNNPKLDRGLRTMEDKAPESIARPLRKTAAHTRNR